MTKQLKKQTGVTLVELMITLAVLAILLGVGIPLFSTTTTNNRSSVQAASFVAAVQYARSEAIKRNTQVSICGKNASANTCNTGNWANGWISFVDASSGVIGNVDNASELLYVFERTGNTAPVVSDDGAFIRFDSDGTVITPAAGFDLSISQASCEGKNMRTMSVNAVGQISTVREACP